MTARPRHTRITARDAAVRIVCRLHDAGHVAYLAGGCVRDALLGLEPKDYDVATDARPQRVGELLPRSRAVGEAFGVVLVYVNGHAIEVATFRTEWGYHDKRRPDEVVFTDAEHDARRRDFTINGLFADPLAAADVEPPAPNGHADRIIDYVGGRADLDAGIVRAIGDPAERFGEDYLRMLRAPRFAARLGFTIEPGTAAAIRPLARRLGEISRERIGQEVEAMLTGPRPALAARLMQELTLDAAALNERATDAPPHTLAALDSEAGYGARLAAWMIDRHLADDRGLDRVADFAERDAPERLRRWRAALCLSNQQHGWAKAVVQLLARARRWSTLGVAARKRLLAEPAWADAQRLLHALPEDERVNRLARESAPLLAEGVAPPPLITGDDLIEIGLLPGPKFGRLLEAVYDAQLEGRLRSRDEALWWARRQAAER